MTRVYDFLGPEGFGTYEVVWDGPTFRKVSAPPKALLIPGFVDIHIHGAFGFDFMSATMSEMAILCDRLEAEGYETFLPTTVTSSPSVVSKAISNLPDHPMIGGFHLEGPFLSPDYPGAQPPSEIVDPPIGDSEWDAILNDPRLRLVTLAPERPHALDLISRLMKRGVLVSMGHTNATFDEARRGFEFGASHTTHTFNAMRPLHHREAGAVGYALSTDGLSTELIYDRIHVVEEAARLLIRSKPIDKVLAVSDSTMATGLSAGKKIKMWGLDCIVGRKEVRLADGGALAGSAITLLDAFRNLHEDFGAETAIRACCVNPRLSMGWPAAPRVYLELDKRLEIVERRVAR
ncbi:MAG: amidohydrolase family protein [Chlorobia bacterium]|nr:amidohydrolase family protein [Fimbriimonadaceae bacterium]